MRLSLIVFYLFLYFVLCWCKYLLLHVIYPFNRCCEYHHELPLSKWGMLMNGRDQLVPRTLITNAS